MATTPRVRVRKDGTTYSQVRYRVTRGGKTLQSSQSFDDHGAAIRWAKLLDRVGAVEAERVLAAQLASAPDVIMLTPWLRRHVDLLGESVEEETKRKYRRMIDHDITPFFNGNFLPVDAVTPDMDVAWVEWLANELGNAPKTIANKHGLLCAAMAAAARRRPTPLIAWNPCAETKLPKRIAREVDHLSEDEFELVDELLAPFWRTWWEFGVMSMARPGEQGALTVGDINRMTGAVSITKAWKWANGRLKLGDPKSARGIRTTFVPLETVARLDLDRDASEPLFVGHTGRPVTSIRFWDEGWAPMMARLGILALRSRSRSRGSSAGAWVDRRRRYGRSPVHPPALIRRPSGSIRCASAAPVGLEPLETPADWFEHPLHHPHWLPSRRRRVTPRLDAPLIFRRPRKEPPANLFRFGRTQCRQQRC